jgi:DNA-directed RNA polymerase specialized sigma24 family protein
VTRIDALFPAVCEGDEEAFAAWMSQVEIPLRRSLAPFARAVDEEGVIQEALVRMWIFAQDRGHTLTGENASLRYTLGMARNLARNEARRFRREHLLPPDDLPLVVVDPDPPPDPGLARIIRLCLEALPRRPREALLSRLQEGHGHSDRSLAEALGMTLNTFLQNIVRGRKQLSRCLEENGAPVEEVLG